MPISVSKTPLFEGNDPIKFSELSSTFKDGTQTNIKFSEYKRNTNLDVENPTVPDATENEAIAPTENNLKISSYRGSIKSYDITQTGTDETLDLGLESTWNGNLNRNIIKRASIAGTCYATSTNNYGVKLEAETYNLDLDISGEVYAEGGRPSSPDGGGALYVRNTTTRTADTATIDVRLNSNAKVWAGGGAGSSGNPGQSGPLLRCNATSTVNRSVSTSGGGSTNCPGNPCPSGYTKRSCNPTDTRARCRGSSPRSSESGYVCAGNWSVSCTRNTTFNRQGSGGNGGAGGPGRGYSTLNNSIAGTSGNSGSSANCNGGTSTGSAGNSGSSGGEWGEPGGGTSGGQKGIAITGNKYRISGSSTNNLKGGTRTI